MAKKFKISVERIDGPTDGKENILIFETTNHDDLLQIAEKVRAQNWLSESDANSIAIGLKLLGEVVLKNRKDELLKALSPALTTFIAGLKQNNTKAT